MKRNKDFTWDTGWTLTRIGRLVHQVSGKFPTAPEWAGETAHPPMDIFEDEGGIHIHVEAPGMRKDELRIRFNRNQLTIEGFKHQGSDIACLRYLCVERTFGVFRRIVEIPVSVDASGAHGTLEEGMLRIWLPKVTEKRKAVMDVPIND